MTSFTDVRMQRSLLESRTVKMSRFSLSLPFLLIFTSIVPPVRSEEAYFDSGGVRLHYRCEGQGEAVVLLHGLMESVDQWDSDGVTVFPELAKKLRVVALDCRGHGKSDKPHDSTQYDDEVITDVVHLLDHLKIEKANLVGYSAGCSVALGVVLRHPDRVLRVTLISGTGNFEPLETDDLGLRMKRAFEGDDNIGIQLIVEGSANSSRQLSTEEARAIAMELRKVHDGKALAAWMQGVHLDAPEITASQLEAIKNPMLILFGSKEANEVDRAGFERFAKYCHGELHCIDGANHDDIAKNPKTLELIRAFLLRK